MASNEYIIADQYKDLTPAPQLDQKTLNKMVWRSLFLQGSFNYERMQAAGWLYGILPGLEKIHTNKEDLATSMSHNMEFFNTHPFLVTFVMGIILSLEQNKVDVPTIRAVRVSAMGPLGGIGDALFWFTLVPITAGITSNMAIQGNAFAPLLFLIIFNVFQFVIRYWLMSLSYKMGTDAISMLTENAKEFTRAASILGVFVVGALVVCYGGTKLGLKIPNGEAGARVAHTVTLPDKEVASLTDKVFGEDGETPLQGTDAAGNAVTAGVTELGNGYSSVTYMEEVTNPVLIDLQNILDGVLPKLLPLAITMLLYFLMVKFNWTPIKCIVLLLVIALLGSGFGNPAFYIWG